MQHSQLTVPLNEEDKNRQNSQNFLSYAGRDWSIPGFFIPKPYRLVKSVYCNEYRILSDDPEPQTLFYIRLFEPDDYVNEWFKKSRFGKDKITQCLVWSSLVPHQRDAFQFLATKFFDFFLETYNIAICIGTMTLCSAHFWEGRILSSFSDKRINVYKCDGNEIVNIPNWLEFQLIWSEFIYKSSENIHDPSVILISKKKN